MGLELAWDATGDTGAPCVVLVHSLGADRTIWASLSGALAPSYRVLRVDLPGHGASPSPRGPYTIEDMADDVLGAVAAAGARRFHYCGISLGGLVGLLLAARPDDSVRSLVAANTAGKIGSAEHWSERGRLVRTRGMGAVGDAIVPRWFAPGFAEHSPSRYEAVRDVFARTTPDGYIACCEALAGADATPHLGRIAAPALIVGGELDASTPVADAVALHAAIPASRLVVLAGAAHLSNLDREEAFNAAVLSFLSEVEARAARAPAGGSAA